jgi:hypothetical protein
MASVKRGSARTGSNRCLPAGFNFSGWCPTEPQSASCLLLFTAVWVRLKKVKRSVGIAYEMPFYISFTRGSIWKLCRVPLLEGIGFGLKFEWNAWFHSCKRQGNLRKPSRCRNMNCYIRQRDEFFSCSKQDVLDFINGLPIVEQKNSLENIQTWKK